MGDVLVTIWTCDRCQKEVTLRGNTDQPTGWGRFYLARPPKCADHDTEGTFCGECVYNALKFLRNAATEVVDNECVGTGGGHGED